MSYLHRAYFNATRQVDLFNANHDVRRAERESKIKGGSLTIFTPSATCGVVLLENDAEIKAAFRELIVSFSNDPKGPRPTRKSGTGSIESHLRAALIPSSLTLPIHEGKLLLGPWQEVTVFDFDDRVGRVEVFIHVTGEAEAAKK